MLQMNQRTAHPEPVGPVRAEGLSFISPQLELALAYWHEIKGEAAFPRRADLVPENIVSLWPHLMMVDVIDSGADYHIRLFGQNLVDYYGEQTGRRISESRAPELVRERSTKLFDFCLECREPCYAYWPVTVSQRRPVVDVEALCLPLSSDGSKLDRLMSLNVNTRRQA
jgi:hypothetical protein